MRKHNAVGNRSGLESLESRLLLSGTAYVVDSLLDTVAADGALTLREALQAANTDTTVNEAPAGSNTESDTITFAPALFAAGPATITLSGTQLEITSDVSILGPGVATLTIDSQGESTDFWIGDDEVSTTLQGITVTGYNQPYDTVGYNGVNIAGGTVAFVDCDISGNGAPLYSRGGGIYMAGGTVTLTDTTVSHNGASAGGGIYVDGGTLTLTRCTINANGVENGYSACGGGVYVEDGVVTLVDCKVSDNRVDGNPSYIWGTVEGTAFSSGGGIYVGGGRISLANCAVNGNVASSSGLGIHQPGLYASSNGGGMYIGGGTATLTNSTFTANNVNADSSYGGAIDVGWGVSLTMTNSVVNCNLVHGRSQAYGGGINCIYPAPTLTNCTISWNSADTDRSSLFYHPPVGGGICGETILNNSIVAGNWADRYKNIHGSWSGRGNFIGGSPGFVRSPSSGADHTWGTQDDDPGDLHLRASSPCVDKAVSSLAIDAHGASIEEDIDGNARARGKAVDIGAYECDTLNFFLDSQAPTVHFFDADGTAVAISYKGPGRATFVRQASGDGPVSQIWGDIQTITIDGSNAKSVLTVTTSGRGAAGETSVEEVTVNGPIKTIAAGRVNLTGDMMIDGAISALSLSDVLGGTISIGTPEDIYKTSMKINLRRALDASVSSGEAIGAIVAEEWSNTDGQATITAPWINTCNLTGYAHGPTPVAGDFGANMVLTATNDGGISLGTFKAAGAITGGTWTIQGDVGSVTADSSSPLWSAMLGDQFGWSDLHSIRTTVGDLSGQIEARSIGRIKTKGSRAGAFITLHPDGEQAQVALLEPLAPDLPGQAAPGS